MRIFQGSIYFILSSFIYLFSLQGISQDPIYELIWYDEFEEDGAINEDKWYHQTQIPQGESWFNGEIQHYTNRLANANVSGGTLKIVANKETYTDQGITKEYTSARLNSKFAFTYGKIEIRAKLPIGIGTWPAMWTLGKNIIEPGAYWTPNYGTVSWPACGEIDMMEHWGINQNYVQSATHTPSSFGATENLGGQAVTNVSDEFHIYTCEWTSDKLIFSVDNVEHYTYNPPIQNADTWPFDADQYILLNVAILPDIDPNFTSSALEIDYVRVYQESALSNMELDGLKSSIVFSNPVEKEWTIQVPQQLSRAQLTLYSVTGKEIDSFKLDEPVTIRDLSALERGIYIVEIAKGTEIYTTKILKI